MKGTKRLAVSESAPDTNDSAFRNKQIMSGSLFDVHRAEPSQQQSMATPPLGKQRAESSRQHVRALNTQFASWVQAQLKNHPDELWEDGVQDYLAHASNIMEKFSDVVDWLKANVVKAGNTSSSEPPTTEKNLVPEIKNNDVKLYQEKTFTPAATTTSFATSGSFGLFSNNAASSGSSGLFSNNAASSGSSGFFSNNAASGSSGLFSSNAASGSPGLFSNNAASGSSGLFSSNAASGISGPFSNNAASGGTGLFSSNAASGSSVLFSKNATSGSSGGFSNSAASWSSGLFSNSQTPVFFGNQSSHSQNHNASNIADDEDELPQPSSPSVKKSEEKGIIVVHEVKCKLYVKSSDPADNDAWKDKGTGHLSIKCKEGVSKSTKESKPTILVRNDVGKVLLNALLYPGIKTNLQKNSLVAIFHTSGDDTGAGNNGSVVASTFLVRTKTEDDRNKLAAAIQEYAPAS